MKWRACFPRKPQENQDQADTGSHGPRPRPVLPEEGGHLPVCLSCLGLGRVPGITVYSLTWTQEVGC